MPVHIARYSLATSMIEDAIEHETVATSVITSSKPLEFSRADYQIHIYFSHEKMPTHLLKLDLFPKESQETEVKYMVITPSVFSSSESLEFFTIVH